jgi:hypothetical protein
VKATSTTKVTKVTTGALSDVTVGATVSVHGTASGSTIAADQVAVLPANTTLPGAGGFPGGRRFGPAGGATLPAGLAMGTVQTVSGSTFTVLSRGTTVTVTTNGSTAFSHTVAATVGQLSIGQPIAVTGTPNSDGSITAMNIEQAGTAGALAPYARPGPFRLGPGGGPFSGPGPGPGTTLPPAPTTSTTG